MKKILAFSGSNSSTSINQQLVTAVANLAGDNLEVDVIKIDRYQQPIYSLDVEKESGIPESIGELRSLFSKYDGFIVSTPEHNGSIPAFFKNTLDWLSRSDEKSMENKKIVLLSTSPGAGGAAKALEYAAKVIPYEGGEIVGKLAFPRFDENFNAGEIINAELKNKIKELLTKLV